MMKQSYIKPSMKWQTIEEDSEILAASPTLEVKSDQVEPSEALSKEDNSFSSNSLWDEDE